MFEKASYDFVGKHGDIIRKLTHEIDENSHFKIFKRNVDALFCAPIVGYLWNRRAERTNDKSSDAEGDKKINFEQLSKNKDIIDFNYQLIMLLHDKKNTSEEERINRAFKYGTDAPERAECDKIYESYILGGLEVLDEKILEGSVTVDDYTKKMYMFINEYKERLDAENMSTDSILEMFM